MSKSSTETRHLGRQMANGHSDSGILIWLAQNLWAIITGIVAIVWFVARKFLTRDQIRQDIRDAIQPTSKQLSKLSTKFDEHDSLPAHPVSLSKMRIIEANLAELRSDVKSLLVIARNTDTKT